MTWEKFYLICFLVGFVLSMVSFLLGSFHLHLHLPHGHAVGAGGHARAHASTGMKASAGIKGGAGKIGTHVSWFNYFTVLAFVAWFGAAGYLLIRHGFVAAVALSLAIVSGLVGATLIFLFFARIFIAHDHPMDQADFEMVGVIGRVSIPIREQGTGEIIYSQAGTRRCAGARSDTGEPISKQTEVVVTRYEKGIAWVREWEKFANEDVSYLDAK